MYECPHVYCFKFFIGIPCGHSCAEIHYLKKDPIDYLDKFFNVKNFFTTRQRFGLLPINGQDMWYEASSAQVLPPPFRVQLGRPKKLRKRETDEAVSILETQIAKLRLFDVQMTCQLCKGVGH